MKPKQKWYAYISNGYNWEEYRAEAWTRTGKRLGEDTLIRTYDFKTEKSARRSMNKLAKELGIELEWE